MKLYIDFETYSECPLDLCGAYVYANHSSTDVLCMSYKFGDGPTKMYKHLEGHKLPQEIIDHIKAGGIVAAWNAFFDMSIWFFVCAKKFGWPNVPLNQWEDTMAKAAAHAFPLKLEKCAEAMELPIGKDTISGKILNKLSKPQKDKKGNVIPNEDGSVFRWYPDTAPDSFATLYKYGIRDTDVMYLIDIELPDLSPVEMDYWRFNHKINARGIYVDKDSIEVILPKITKEVLQFNNRVSILTNGVITKITQVQRIKKFANSHGVDLPNTQKETLEEYLKTPEQLPDIVREILEMRLMGGKSSTGKYETMRNMAHIDNRVRGTLVYCGAIKTGRWAGRGIQPHNYPKPTVEYESIDQLIDDLLSKDELEINEQYGSFMHAASTATRGMICAPPRKILYIADYNAIEPRILFWLAGATEALEVYRQGGDIYVVMAAGVYNKNPSDIDGDERWLGKQIILGCGYGMGPPKFVGTCANYGRHISLPLAEQSVYAYRDQYYQVVNLWNKLEESAMKAVAFKGKIYPAAGGKLLFKMVGKHLYMKLPSGRKIVYPFARLENVKTPWGQVKKALTYRTIENQFWRRTSTFGGKIAENACQGIARDFMIYGMIEAENEGYEMVTTVHDEAVAEQYEGKGDLDQYCELLVRKDSWGKDCPLAAEGKVLKRYQKI